MDAANEFLIVTDHLDGCPEKGNPDTPGCPCGYVEAKKSLTEAVAEAKALIEAYT